MDILCLLTDAYGGNGGIALFNRNVVEALTRQPDVDELIVLPRVVSTELQPIPAKVRHVSAALGGVRSYVAALLKEVRKARSVGFIFCGHVNLSPLAWFASRVLGVPWFLCIHGTEAWTRPRSIARYFVPRADRILAVSQMTIDRFRAWSGVEAERCRLLVNAFRPEEFALVPKDQDLSRKWGVTDQTVIMTLGRLSELEQAKGFDRVIRALPDVARLVPDIAYVIVGSGDDKARLEIIAQECGVSDRIHFAGFVPEEEKAKAYSVADAYVMPSTGEGFGIVYLEAMACGLPVVGSAVDGSVEALKNGELGQLIDPFDKQSLVDAIVRAVRQPRAIPEGLDWFSYDNFCIRLNEALSGLMRPAAQGVQAGQ